jgi:fibro-slime domain-containing protein
MLLKRVVITYFFCVFILLTTASMVSAQSYPETIWVPVTYYDFHSDRSNPEFEAQHEGALRAGMVAEDLGADGKPKIGPTPYLNYYMSKWFVPWQSGDLTIPDYFPHAPYKVGFYSNPDTMFYFDSSLNRDTFNIVDQGWKREFQQTVVYRGVKTVDYDTAFKNIVIKDSLPFRHIGNGVYEYNNDKFFPLDNKGFGNEWNHEGGKNDKNLDVNHNYSFTMELHWSFVKKAGMTFDFNGDDDVFVFLNKKLQIDLGGIHKPEQKSFSVDNITGLANGKTYDLDVFYAERHSAESHIRITTNLIYSPSNIKFYEKRGTPNENGNNPLGDLDTVEVGKTFVIYGNIFDSLGVWKPEYNKYITWSATSLGGNPALSATSGDSTAFSGMVANTSVTITAKFINPDNGKESERSITLYVKSQVPPSAFTIKFYDSDKDPSTLTPITSFAAQTGSTTTIYAHVFDAGNVWLPRYDSLITWSISVNPDGIIITPLKGNLTRITPASTGNRKLLAELVDPDNASRPKSKAEIPFSVTAGPVAAPYQIRFYSVDGDPAGLTPITSISGKASEQMTVYAHLFDSANVWLSEYDKLIRWGTNPVAPEITFQPAEGSKVTVSSSKSGTFYLDARFKDPDNSKRPESGAQLPVTINAGLEDHVQIVTDTVKMVLDTTKLEFSSKVTSVQLFGVVRDKDGNFIRYTDVTARWTSLRLDLASVSNVTGPTTNAIKVADYSDELVKIVLQEGNLKPDTVAIEFNGKRSAIAAPVPFVPGKTIITKVLPPKVVEFYRNIIDNLPNHNESVVLIGVTTEGVLIPLNPADTTKSDLSKVSYGKVRIYDGVGNLVRSDCPLLRAKNSKAYAVTWDGTNSSGRVVGVGAYLADTRGREIRKDGRVADFSMRVKVAVSR